MSSMEQMGSVPEQPKEIPMEPVDVENDGDVEPSGTSPEEAVEMTRQRRMAYGLAESSDLTPEETGAVNEEIESLLDSLSEHDYDLLSPEMQDAWYAAQMEAEVGKDRELARAVLGEFLRALEDIEGVR